MALVGKWTRIVEISGTGTSVEDVEVFGSPAKGRITGVMVREEVGGLATSLSSLWLTHTPSAALIGAVPDGAYVVMEGGVLALTPSATVQSIRTRIDTPPEFVKGLGLTVGVVATGAWILQVTISFDDLDGPGIV